MILDIVSQSSPILKEVQPKFDFSNPPVNPVELYYNLGETMIANNGLGLAAPQCSLPYRAFVIRAEQIIGVFNPIIVDMSMEQIYLEEGCLSCPGLFVKVKRPKKIRVRYTLPNGEVETHTYDGMTARVFLHEYDHLEGILHTQKASLFHREQARNNKKKNKITANSLSNKTKEIIECLKN